MQYYYFSPHYNGYKQFPSYGIIIGNKTFIIDKEANIFRNSISEKRLEKMIKDKVLLNNIPDMYKIIDIEVEVAKMLLKGDINEI